MVWLRAFFIAVVLMVAGISSSSADISLDRVDMNSLALTYHAGKADTDTVSIDSTPYIRHSFPGHSLTGSSGEPGIPAMSVIFAAPSGATPLLTVNSISPEAAAHADILPIPSFETDASGFGVEQYICDPSAYAFSGYLPKSHVMLDGPETLGSLDLWEVTFSPVLYDAFRSGITAIDSMKISISFTGGFDPANFPAHIPDYLVNGESIESISVKKPAKPTSNPFEKGDWYKISIGESGVYRLTAQDLIKAGFPIGSIRIDDIRMYYGGGKLIDSEKYDFSDESFRETAIMVEDVGRDGLFSENDTIVFYGEDLTRFYIREGRLKLYHQNHLYADNNAYWLTISSEGTPLRMQSAGEAPNRSLEALTVYKNYLHVEPELHPELVDGGKEWYWKAISNDYSKVTINTPGALPGVPSKFRIGILNQLKQNIRTHGIFVYLNDEHFKLYDLTAPKGIIAHEYNGDLIDGNNILNIYRKSVVGDNNITFRLDYVEVEYDRILSYDSNHFEFIFTGNDTPVKFRMANVPKPTIKILDTTDPFRATVIDRTIYDSQEKALTFQTTLTGENPSRFIAFDSIDLRAPVSVERLNGYKARAIPNGANYVIITRDRFMSEARRLADWRSRDSQADPLVTMVVDYDDIVNEFNWGVSDPMAIRSFLKTVYDVGDSDKNYYCCILGDAIYKYKDMTEEQAEGNVVPSYSDFDIGYRQALTNDDFFTWFTDHKLPVFAMGRLCVRDTDTAAAVVDKIIAYEKETEYGYWRNRVLLIADDEVTDRSKQEIIHTNQTESLDDPEFIPSNIEREKLLMIEYPFKDLRKPEATESLIASINKGHLLTNFIGHGNDDLIAHEHLLVGTRDIDRISNGKRMPVFLFFSCSVGKFLQLDNISLAEILQQKHNGGGLAVVAATEKTFSHQNLEVNKAFMKCFFDTKNNPEYRVGLALKNAKNRLPSNDTAIYYMLFGDPASRVMVPRYRFGLPSIEEVKRLEKLKLSGSVTENNSNIAYDGTLYITARGPRIKKTYTTEKNLNNIEYSMPGRLFFSGESTISGNTFDTSLIVPKDLPSSNSDSAIYMFASGQNTEASGVISNFKVGGLDPQAPDDRSGPEIQLMFDGKSYEDGDYISRQPLLSATFTDPSGINIYGNRGHNITLLIDKKEIIVLTEHFKAVNGFTTGKLEYQLPVLTPGEHSVEISVFDTYNNASKMSVTANVVGSETGDIAIRELLNYPNPMSDNGTTFTFSLTDDARSADIKVYSQAGRLVDSFKFPAAYGFNQVDWKPPFSIANGVYFYKLTVKSVNGRKSTKIEKLVVMK